MAGFDLVVRNGTVVTASDTFRCDVGIRGGRIAALAEGLDGERLVDATGVYVLPGGVDSHAHVEQRNYASGAGTDSFASASLSAAFGGTTTMITHCLQERGGSLAESLADYSERAEASVIDYAFHLLVTDPTATLLERDLPAAAAAGHRSIKLFMSGSLALDDRPLIALLAKARDLAMQPAIHAENQAAIEWLTRRLVRDGRTDARFKPLANPVAIEREAVHRILTYAEIIGVPVHIFHVSAGEAVDEIERSQKRGVRATGETCPQYLCFTAADLDRPVEEAAKLVFGPPPRTVADQEALWSAIGRGVIDVISSDHAPHPYSGEAGKLAGMRKGGFPATPQGIPGLETRMTLFYSAGVGGGRIDLNRFVALTATNPARRFGLYPRKGSIIVGGDADMVLWDPEARSVIRNADLHHGVEYTPYEGMSVRGGARMVISRGDIIIDQGRSNASEGRGRLVPRGGPTA